MGKVIPGKGHFQLKSALDGATKNLGKIHAAVSETTIADAGHSEASMRLVQRFLNGEIEPFPVPFEDSDVLYDIMDDQGRYGRLLKTIYAYKSDPGLTLAMALRFPQATVMKVVRADGYLLTTGLWNEEKKCLLNVNGVHAQEAFIAHMVGNSLGEPVVLVTTSASELSGISSFNAEDLEIAFGQFGFVANFMMENLSELTSEPKSWTIDEEDDYFLEP